MGLPYRREIDGLRAIAVLAVVLFHAGLGGAGYVGVDVFFVISGYLITALLLDEHRATGRIDLLAFYARRVRRIVPAVALVVLVVLALSWWMPPSEARTDLAKSAAAALLFVANVFFEFETGGYWDAASEAMPLLHLWSLSVEEQFYLLWPLLLLCTRSRKAFAALAIASLLLAEYWIARDAEAAFFRMPARFWELAAGGWIATLPRKPMPRGSATIGVAITLVACVVPFAHFPGVGALPAVAGAALVLAAVHGGATNAFLASAPMVGVGLISYSLYLWHWPLLAMYRDSVVGEGTPEMRLALCAIAVVLAVVSYRYVEQPFRKLRVRSGRTVLAGATLSVVLASAAFLVGMRAPEMQRDPFPLATQAERDLPPPGCSYTVGDTAFPKCPITARTALWGDSLAYAWRPYAESLGPVADFSRQACGPYLGWMPADPKPGDTKCRDFNAQVVRALRGMDTVVVAARWNRERLGAFRASLAAVAPHVGRVIVLGPTPQLPEPVPACIRSGDPQACAISRAAFDAGAAPLLAELRAAAAAFDNVEVIDPADAFCTKATCPPVLEGVPLYVDTYHVSTTAVRAFISLRPLARDVDAPRSIPVANASQEERAMARHPDQKQDRNPRGSTRTDQDTERALNAGQGDSEAAREAAPDADRDVQSGGRTSTGSLGRRSEGTDQGSSRKH